MRYCQVNITLYHSTATDHLGSICQLIEPDGTVVEQTNYGPWGRVRDPHTWQYDQSAHLTLIPRGYTGHEMLREFGLINMNGRVYDPLTSRFLSPDNFVQNPNNPQNYNRYAYALNNPLKYVDPDGEWVHLLIGAIVGGVINWAVHGAEFSWEGLGYFAIGAVAGALSAGVGAGVSSALAGGSFAAGFIGSSSAMVATTSFTTGAIIGGSAGFTNGFITGFGNSLIEGNDFTTSFINGIGVGLEECVSGALIGGTISGIDALRDGRTFWTGEVKGEEYFITSNEPIKTSHLKKWEVEAKGDDPQATRYYKKMLKRINNPIALDASEKYPQSRYFYLYDKHGPVSFSYRGYIPEGSNINVYINNKLEFSITHEQMSYAWQTTKVYHHVKTVKIIMTGIHKYSTNEVIVVPTFDFRIITHLFH